MLTARLIRFVGLTFVALSSPAKAATAALQIGVSESAYADLAQQVGGSDVVVTLVQRSRTAAALPAFDLVICGGYSPDNWLCDAARNSSPPISVLEVVHSDGPSKTDFPWYDVVAMSDFVQRLAVELTRLMPAEKPRIATNSAHALVAFHALDRRIAEVAKDYRAEEVLLGDPLFQGMAERLHFKIQDADILKNFDRGTRPSAKTVAGIEQALERRKGSIFVYDKDANLPGIKDLIAVANEGGIPVVAFKERMPTGLHYQQWMLRQLNAIHGALNEAAP